MDGTLIHCPMRLRATIDVSRVVEHQLSMLPVELWRRIFNNICPVERVGLMWSLAIRYPAFAYIFSRDPSMWMILPLRVGGVRRQTRQVRFSIGLWLELHRAGRYLPIAIRADTTVFNLWDVVGQLPPSSRHFVSSLHLKISRQSYFTFSFASLLSVVPRLTHLTLAVFRTSVMESAITPPLVFHCDQLTVPHGVLLTSLSLHDMVVRRSSLSPERWNKINRLHIMYYRAHPSNHPSLYEVLFAAPNLRVLLVEVSWSLADISRALFTVAAEARQYTWDSRLSVIDVQGDYHHIPAFISSLLSWPRIAIQTIRIVYNCDTTIDDAFLYEIPEFIEATMNGWDVIVVNVDELSIELVSERHRAGVRCWFIKWRLYNYWRSYWPHHKFQRWQNKFRLFVARIVFLNPPVRFTIVSRSPIGSIFAAMPGPCYISRLRLVGGLLMYESLLRYILQYHELFPDLVQIDYHPSSGEDMRDHLTAFSRITMLDPPIVPVNESRRILLTISPVTEKPSIYTFFRSLFWNISSPKDSVSM